MRCLALDDSTNVTALSEMTANLSIPSFTIDIEISDRLGAASSNTTMLSNDDRFLSTTVHRRDSVYYAGAR